MMTWMLIVLISAFVGTDALVAQEIQLGAPEASFGAMEAPPDHIIGEISTLAVDPDGQVLIVDDQTDRVGWWTPSAEFMGWVGRSGSGPEEFQYLQDAEVHPDGRFIVLDQGQGRLILLNRGEDGLAFDETIRIQAEMIPWRLCLLGERIFVSALYDGLTVHELSWQGEVLHSFGPPIRGYGNVSERYQRLVDRYTVMGDLVCVEDRNLIIQVPGNTPEVRAFNPRGEPLWTHRLEPWAQASPFENEAGRFVYAMDPETNTVNHLGSAWLYGDDLVLQIRESDLSRAVEGELEVRVLDLTGNGSRILPEKLPRIVAVRGTRAFGDEVEPFPRVLRWPIGSR